MMNDDIDIEISNRISSESKQNLEYNIEENSPDEES